MNDEQRALFEAWAKSQKYNLSKKFGLHEYNTTRIANAAWQACLAANAIDQPPADDEREREMQRQYDNLRIDWVAAVYDQVQYETLLKEAHASVCSIQCLSQWKTSEGQQHSPLCRKITAALKKGPSE